jgi:hydrogenase maturation factor
MYVYVVPAQTEQGVYPLGGDVRYLVSPEGSKIVEKRQLHKSIIEFTTPTEAQKVEAGYHTAVLDDIPEDTDVFHVLSRKPSVPEWVMTQQYVYRIETNGTINYVMMREAFMRIRGK